jgi:hypothetical protein
MFDSIPSLENSTKSLGNFLFGLSIPYNREKNPNHRLLMRQNPVQTPLQGMHKTQK